MPRDIHGNSVLPNAIEAEQALLGALLMKNDCIEAVPANFEARHFEERLHSKMYEAMLDLRAAGKSFSPITLKSTLNLPDYRIGEMTVAQYMSRLMTEAVGYVGIPDWCAAITAAAARRDLHSLADDLRQIAFEEEMKIPDDVAALRQRLADVTQSLAQEEASTSDQAVDEYLTAITGGRGQGVAGGIPICLPELEYVLSDKLFRPTRLYGLLSSSGEGKTSLTLQIVYTALMAGHPVIILSYDQSRNDCIAQMAAQHLGIEMRRQLENTPERPLLNQSEIDDCYAFGRRIFSMPFEVIDCKADDTVSKLAVYAERFCRKHRGGKTPLIVIDHARAIKPEDMRADEGSKALAIGQRLKSVAKDMCAVVLLLQQRSSSGMSRRNPRPIDDDLYGKEGARQPFDSIFYLYRPDLHRQKQLDSAEDEREADKIRARFHQTYEKPFEVPIEGTAEIGCLKVRFGDKSRKGHVNFEATYTRYVSRREKTSQERML